MFRSLYILMIFSLFTIVQANEQRPGKLVDGINPGSLTILQVDGKKTEKKLEMPLQHTDVQIEVSGFVARATVTQQYTNPFEKPIEAVYTFPLPNDAAVDDMQMIVGDRVIKGIIKKREEARKIYDTAKQAGKRTSLLEQERPNIFTQSVANIMPSDDIKITIRYVNILKYSEGNYELVFPMVVGPRYIPGNVAVGKAGRGTVPDTDIVPDASRITPPVLKPGERTGHDISLSVKLDAGVPIQKVHSASHVIDTKNISKRASTIELHPADTIPNKDFILRYAVAGQAPEMAIIPHYDQRGGFFTLIVQPQRSMTDSQIVPRELIFIVDTSGSMHGFPLDKSKEAMRRLIKGMRPTDTFNVVRFAGDTGTLWSRPQSYTLENAETAIAYVDNMQGGGGTQMRKGIIEALSQPAEKGYLRIAFLLTDGYVGDEDRIFQSIEKEARGARIFTLGVGSSVNRYLLDRAAVVGRGEAFYVRQDESSQTVIDNFFNRVDKPALAHITIDWGNLNVEQLYPSKVPDLWAGQPIRIHGRYQHGGKSEVVVRGQLGTRSYEQRLNVNLPTQAPEHEAMASVWAREKVKILMLQMARFGQKPDLVEKITQVGLMFNLMTQWTSFVAVEEKVVNQSGQVKTVIQPVELPEGVSYEGVFGDSEVRFDTTANTSMTSPALLQIMPSAPPRYRKSRSPTNAFMAPQESLEEAEDEVDSDLSDVEEPIKEEKTNVISKVVSNDYVVFFTQNQMTLTKEAEALLDKIAANICQNLTSIKHIFIVGHADNTESNTIALSMGRAKVVGKYLQKKCSIPAAILVIKAKGSSAPDAQLKSQRVVIKVKG